MNPLSKMSKLSKINKEVKKTKQNIFGSGSNDEQVCK